MNGNFSLTTKAALIALVAAAGLASPAAAQSVRSTTIDRDSDRMTMTEMADGDRYKLELNDGALRIWVNGEEVPANRYRRMGSRVELLDDYGRVQRVFSMEAPTPPPAPEMGLRATVDVSSRPPVMLGVTLSSPSEALRNQLGLAPEGGILINSVVEGLPADRAGLKPFDIIVQLNGSREVATQTALRDILRERKPGDTLKVTVLRGGEKRELTLKLEAYDAGKLNAAFPEAPAVPGAPGAPAAPLPPRTPEGAVTIERDLGGWFSSTGQDAARTALEAAMAAMKDLDAQLPAEMREQVAQARQQVAEAMKSLDEQGLQGLRFNFPGAASGGSAPFVLDNNRLIRIPWAERDAEQRQADAREAESRAREMAERLREDLAKDRERIVVRTEDQIRSIEQRMRELDERLSRFERTMDRFEKLVERMERDQ
jgi:hypothetical protein